LNFLEFFQAVNDIVSPSLQSSSFVKTDFLNPYVKRSYSCSNTQKEIYRFESQLWFLAQHVIYAYKDNVLIAVVKQVGFDPKYTIYDKTEKFVYGTVTYPLISLLYDKTITIEQSSLGAGIGGDFYVTLLASLYEQK
jgi:hypothetical protein